MLASGSPVRGGQAWAVGEYLNSSYQDRALLEHWNGTSWSIADNPQPGSTRDMLFGASALSPTDVWVVGDQEGREEQLRIENWMKLQPHLREGGK